MKIRLNENQSKIFANVFTKEMFMREDCPREIAFWGGYGSGKSFITIIIAYNLCSQHKGVQLLMTRYSYRQLKDTCIVQFKEVYPPDEYGYVHAKADNEFQFNNNSRIIFRSFDDPRKILSSSYDVVIMCQAEELKEEHFLGALGRLRGTALPKKLIFTGVTLDLVGVKRDIMTKTYQMIVCIFVQVLTVIEKTFLLITLKIWKRTTHPAILNSF